MAAPPTDTTEVVDPTRVEPTEADADPSARPPWRTAMRYLGMPAFLTVVLAGLYAYVQGADLDSVAERSITREVLTARVIEHLQLTGASTLIVLLLAIPAGIAATRPGTKRFAGAIVGLGNAGQALPSIGLLGLLYYLFRTTPGLPSTGFVPVVVGLVAYSFLPILRNTMVGLQQVDQATLEAGRGMGMSNWLVLRRIELPLAIPVILAGIRTALVLNVGTATLAYVIGGGALGEIILTGYGLRRTEVLITGAVLVAVLALAIDYLAGIVEERLTPRGL
jgi:osmoprotectant transport system permease protein